MSGLMNQFILYNSHNNGIPWCQTKSDFILWAIGNQLICFFGAEFDLNGKAQEVNVII